MVMADNVTQAFCEPLPEPVLAVLASLQTLHVACARPLPASAQHGVGPLLLALGGSPGYDAVHIQWSGLSPLTLLVTNCNPDVAPAPPSPPSPPPASSSASISPPTPSPPPSQAATGEWTPPSLDYFGTPVMPFLLSTLDDTLTAFICVSNGSVGTVGTSCVSSLSWVIDVAPDVHLPTALDPELRVSPRCISPTDPACQAQNISAFIAATNNTDQVFYTVRTLSVTLAPALTADGGTGSGSGSGRRRLLLAPGRDVDPLGVLTATPPPAAGLAAGPHH